MRANPARGCLQDEERIVMKRGGGDIISATMTFTPGSGNPTEKQRRNWLSSVLTDVHFWVPVLVLLAGLLLLRYVR
jgi:hypothetical protein